MRGTRFTVSLLLLLTILLCAAQAVFAAGIVPADVNGCSSALSVAEDLAAPYRAVLDAFMSSLTDDALEEAKQRGDQLVRKLNGTESGGTITLTGHTVFRESAMPRERKNGSAVIDLAGYVLVNPALPGGTWEFRNGTVANAVILSESNQVSIRIADDCAFLVSGEKIFDPDNAFLSASAVPAESDDSPSGFALSVSASSQISIDNRGLIQGAAFPEISKLFFSNSGTVASHGRALYLPAGSRPNTRRITNSGTIVSPCGCILDGGNAQLTAEGQGAIYSYGSLTLFGKACSVSCPLVADSTGLSPEVTEQLEAAGSVPGIIYDLVGSDRNYLSKITLGGPLWASATPVRARLPSSGGVSVTIDGAPAAGSPSVSVQITLTLEDGKEDLIKQAKSELKTAMKALKLEKFCKKGGRGDVTAYRRTKDSSGKYTALLSAGKTSRTRLTGTYDGKSCVWGEPEEMDSVSAALVPENDRLPRAAEAAGKNGLLIADCDLSLTDTVSADFASGMQLEGNGHTVSAPEGKAVRITLDGSAGIRDLTLDTAVKVLGTGDKKRGASEFTTENCSFRDLYCGSRVRLNAKNCTLPEGAVLTVSDASVTLADITAGSGAVMTVTGGKTTAPMKNVCLPEDSTLRLTTAYVEADAGCSFGNVELISNPYVLYNAYDGEPKFTSKAPVRGRLMIRAGVQDIYAETDTASLEIFVDRDYVNKSGKTVYYTGHADRISFTVTGKNTCKAIQLSGSTGSEPAMLILDSAAPAGSDLTVWYKPYLSLIKAKKMTMADGQPLTIIPQPQPEDGTVIFTQDKFGSWIVNQQ